MFFFFQDRVLYLVACGVLLQSRTVCTDFFLNYYREDLPALPPTHAAPFKA